MAHPHTIPPIQFGLPVGGINARDALSEMAPIYSPWMVNFNAENQYLSLRNGYQRHPDSTGYGANETLIQIGDYNGSFLYALTHNSSDNKLRVYDHAGASPSLEYTSSGTYTGDISVGFFRFANRIAFTLPETFDEGIVFNGTSWTTWGFEDGSTNPVGGVPCVSYKGRVYMCSGTDVYYSALEAVTGDCTLWDTQYLFDSAGEIVWIGRLTSPANVSGETYLALGNRSGDVIVYAGDNPDANNWEQVGRFNISDPTGYQSILEYNNDLWISTRAGIYSLRKLFTHGSESDEVMVTKMIEPFWKLLQVNAGGQIDVSPTFDFPTYGAGHVSFAYDKTNNRVFARMGGYLTDRSTVAQDGSTHFVYNGSTGSWSMHTVSDSSSTQFYDAAQSYPCYSGYSSFHYISGNSIMYYEDEGYKDEEYDNAGTYVSYDSTIESAYHGLGNNNKYKTALGLEPIIKLGFTDSANTIKAQMASDFGRNVTDETGVSLVSGYNFPNYNAPVEGSFLQYRINVSQDLTTNGSMELYAAGVPVK